MRVAVPNLDTLDPNVRAAFEVLIGRLNTVFEKEHNGDGTHRTISERGRSVPLGEWIAIPFNPTDYTGNNAMTWTVALANVTTAQYMLIGKTMFVMLVLANTTVAGTPSTTLSLKVPGGFLVNKSGRWANIATDNGTVTTTLNRVDAGSRTMDIQRQDSANWTASAGNSNVRFHGFFEVQ